MHARSLARAPPGTSYVVVARGDETYDVLAAAASATWPHQGDRGSCPQLRWREYLADTHRREGWSCGGSSGAPSGSSFSPPASGCWYQPCGRSVALTSSRLRRTTPASTGLSSRGRALVQAEAEQGCSPW